MNLTNPTIPRDNNYICAYNSLENFSEEESPREMPLFRKKFMIYNISYLSGLFLLAISFSKYLKNLLKDFHLLIFVILFYLFFSLPIIGYFENTFLIVFSAIMGIIFCISFFFGLLKFFKNKELEQILDQDAERQKQNDRQGTPNQDEDEIRFVLIIVFVCGILNFIALFTKKDSIKALMVSILPVAALVIAFLSLWAVAKY